MSFFDKAKALAQKYEVVFACSAAAAATYFVIQNLKDKELLEELIVSLMVLRDEHDEVLGFLDNKALRDEFMEYSRKMHENAPS